MWFQTAGLKTFPFHRNQTIRQNLFYIGVKQTLKPECQVCSLKQIGCSIDTLQWSRPFSEINS